MYVDVFVIGGKSSDNMMRERDMWFEIYSVFVLLELIKFFWILWWFLFEYWVYVGSNVILNLMFVIYLFFGFEIIGMGKEDDGC